VQVQAIVVAASVLAVAGPVAAEVTRTVKVELQGDPGRPFGVENLAGTMTVRASDGNAVVAVATVHAESQALADTVRFEQVVGETGVPTLRVRYPMDQHRTFRYREGRDGGGGSGWLASLFDGWANGVKYDGHRVQVSSRHGALLYADVEVQVPRRDIDGRFRQVVGSLGARDVQGRARFDTGSGNLTIDRARGEIKADTGSGNVKASGVEGRFDCDTGSGNCEITGFKGELLECDTGSGEVTIRDAAARQISADTGSGTIDMEADVEEVKADTGSGDVRLQNRGRRLSRVIVDTGSGSVRLRLGPEASFEVLADTGSGDVVSRYEDAQPIVRRKEVVGYRRGTAQARISVDTGSGDVVVEPGLPGR
jgi:hypothetical protein